MSDNSAAHPAIGSTDAKMKTAETSEDSCGSEETVQADGRFTALDLGRLLSEVAEPIPWTVDGWLVQRDVVCLAGEPKTGKSWIAQDLALSLATGGKFLGLLPILGGPYRVLYVDEENNETLVKHRLRKLAVAYGLSAEVLTQLPLRYLYENTLNLDDNNRLRTFFDEVEEFNADWVIFDSLVRFHRRDENNNSQMAEFFARAIKSLTVHCGAGVIGIHHLSKPSMERSGRLAHRVRGASDILAVVDQLWGLEQDPSQLWLRHERSRWAETACPLAVTIGDVCDDAGVRVVATEDDTPSETLVLALLRERGASGALRQDIIQELKKNGIKAPDRAASRCLGKLQATGRVLKKSEGRAARYWVTEHAPEDAVKSTRDTPGT